MSQNAAPLIATDVHRTYHLAGHDLPVLRGVDLEVKAGEKVFLCGQSGAGKTTLLYVLGGLEQPTAGDVLVHGRSLYKSPAGERARMRNEVMSFVFQHYFLLPELTALENVTLPAMIGGRKAEDRARELLSKVGLAERLDHLPTELSGGEQQRVAIARAIAKRPEVLLCDEPTGALDVNTGITVLEAVERINRELGTLTVVITHNAAMADMADRVLHLSDGHIVKEHRNATRMPASGLKW